MLDITTMVSILFRWCGSSRAFRTPGDTPAGAPGRFNRV